MNIGLIDVDSHNFPNLALMKISAYHKSKGDNVEWWNGLKHYNRVYKSKVFDDTYTKDMEFCVMADEVIMGGSGYDLKNKLPDEIEHQYPDYSIYGIKDTAFGFLTRGCPRSCPFCITSVKDGRKSVKVANLREFWNGQKNIELLDQNILACKEHEDLLKQLADSRAIIGDNGIDVRLITSDNVKLITGIRWAGIHFAWDFMNSEAEVKRGLELYKKHAVRKSSGHGYANVYVLTNYNTSHEEDLYRVENLKSMQYEPFIMIFDKPNAPKITKHLQRYVNNRFIFYSTTWEDYMKGRCEDETDSI